MRAAHRLLLLSCISPINALTCMHCSAHSVPTSKSSIKIQHPTFNISSTTPIALALRTSPSNTDLLTRPFRVRVWSWKQSGGAPGPAISRDSYRVLARDTHGIWRDGSTCPGLSVYGVDRVFGLAAGMFYLDVVAVRRMASPSMSPGTHSIAIGHRPSPWPSGS